MAGPFGKLPALLRIAATAGGVQAAIGLIKAEGGRFVYIPRRAAKEHWLVLAAGRAAADAVVREFGGTMLFMPNGGGMVRRAIAAEALAGRKSFNEAVELSGLHYRTVQRIARTLREGSSPLTYARRIQTAPKRDERQLDLEDWLKATAS